VNLVPANTDLQLLLFGMVQQPNGTWASRISSSPSKLNLLAAAPSCLPAVGFAANKALAIANNLQNVSQNTAVTAGAVALGLSNAASSSLILPNAGAFAGAIVPVSTIVPGTSAVNEMFVVLAWSALPANALLEGATVSYVVTKNNVQVYSGPLTSLVDVVTVNPTNPLYKTTTYGLQAQTSTCTTSQIVYTTCPPLSFTAQMCTAIPNGSLSLYNFLIPDPNGNGCSAILATDQDDAAFYNCAYLQNKARTLDGLQVPNSDRTQCVTINKVTNPVILEGANNALSNYSILDSQNVPTGYCQGVTCSQGGIQATRSALCACGGNPDQCRDQMGSTGTLPFVTLSDGSVMKASDFSTGFQGMSKFIQENPKLLFQ
jgi:hypothetical protein